jgi:hypothetical protein
LYRGVRKGQMPSQRLNELDEIADVNEQQNRLDQEILTWLATSAKQTATQERAEDCLVQKQLPAP